MSAEYPIALLCQVLKAARSGYYKWLRQPISPRTQANVCLQSLIKSVFLSSREVYGSPRLAIVLKANNHSCSENKVAKLMRKLGLKARQKPAFRPKTTNSNHDQPIAPNRLAASGPPTRPNQIWVADITCVYTQQGWLYLAAVMDLFTRIIVGWAADHHMKSQLVEQAWNNAVSQHSPAQGLIAHSDRGSQYASKSYRTLLAKSQALSSMSRTGNCYDNAAMEAFWSTLKTEELHHHHFATQKEAKLAIFNYIETFYNRKRIHSALGYKSPVEFELDYYNEKI